MNVEIRTEAMLFLFWEHLFRISDIVSLQFTAYRWGWAKPIQTTPKKQVLLSYVCCHMHRYGYKVYSYCYDRQALVQDDCRLYSSGYGRDSYYDRSAYK
jgi:hypothetical protein